MAAVDDDPVDPGGDAALVPERPARPVDLKENVLGDVFGVLGVVEQARAEAEDPALIELDEGLESPEVLGGDPAEQRAFVQRFRGRDLVAP